MKLVVGLGNPGEKYEFNRHNVGFMVIDKFVNELGLSWQTSQDWMCNFTKNDDAVFVKPTTFMNKSGAAVSVVSNFFKIKQEDILVIYDEVDLPYAKIRMSHEGLSAGHQGIESIIKSLGGFEFSRLRVGIGRPKEDDGKRVRDIADFVLEDFTDDEKKILGGVIAKCVEAVKSYLADGLQATMNKFN